MTRSLALHLPRRARGQALVEFAIAFPILILAMVAVMEMGFYALTQTAINHGAHEGGRVAALPGTTAESSVTSRVITASEPVVVTSSNISVAVNGVTGTFTTKKTGDRVVVRVNHTHRPLLGLVFGSGVTFALSAESEFRVE